ncbi:hypothetical protein MVEN_01047500 [Mycena venus]|uniref:Uncharacterized protein n=1 Tax=Mycena venus TaxID=2733690 RepID=A0A8H6Y3S8_9AGAR|nr:hypothetical protein MVEN_01047500 [Mycena venus]
MDAVSAADALTSPCKNASHSHKTHLSRLPLTTTVHANPHSFSLSLQYDTMQASLLKVFSLLALAAISSTLASPLPAPSLAVRAMLPGCTTANGIEICNNTRRSYHEGPSRDRVPAGLTNGERLARHLPLKPPTRRSSARRAVASPAAPPANRGYIQVLSVDDNGNPTGVLGYVSRTTYAQRQYLVQPSIDDALLVAPSGDRNLGTLNSDIPSLALLGLVQSREDTSSGLAKGISNYLYLASTEQTPPNATPQNVGNSFSSVPGGPLPSESAVWTHDPVTHTLKAQWINPDGSPAPTIAFTHGPAIYLGDPEAFYQAHEVPVRKIAFVFMAM